MGCWIEREDGNFSVQHAEFQETGRKASENVWQTVGGGRMIGVREQGWGDDW